MPLTPALWLAETGGSLGHTAALGQVSERPCLLGISQRAKKEDTRLLSSAYVSMDVRIHTYESIYNMPHPHPLLET